MARSLTIVGKPSPITPSPRKEQVRLGVWIELVTIVWMMIEAGVAITIGFATHSVSLRGMYPFLLSIQYYKQKKRKMNTPLEERPSTAALYWKLMISCYTHSKEIQR